METVIYSETISTSSTPVLVGTNPIPDGSGTIYINVPGALLFYIDFVTWQGNINYQIVGNTSGSLEQFSATLLANPLPDNTYVYLNYLYTDSSNNGFYVSSDNPETDILVNICIIPANVSGNLTINNVYTTGGLVPKSLIWTGSGTTTSGAFSIDISSAGFTTINSVNATAVNNTSSPIAVPISSISTVSTTTITGNVVQGDNVILGGASLVSVADGTVVYTTVYGS